MSTAAERRRLAGEAFFDRESERIARLCHRMAERFARGGRLIAFGEGPVARSDARHVAVEFVHPVIVGKRALPALALTAEGGPVAGQLALLAEPADIALAFGEHPETATATALARERGCLTLAAAHVGAEWELSPRALPGGEDDAFIEQELVETLYHVLWELVHVFLEHPGLLAGRAERPVHDSGASSFLYPFLGEQETDLDGVLEDVRGSVLMKAREIAELRAQTLGDNCDELAAAAEARRRGIRTIAMVGYDGGRVAAEQLADHVVVTRSEHIPRIQEAQASAYHLLRELVAA